MLFYRKIEIAVIPKGGYNRGMSTVVKRLLLSCGVIALAACLCLSAVNILGAGWLLLAGQEEAVLPPTSTEPPAPPQQPIVTASPSSEAPSPGETLSPDLMKQMDAIEQQVISLRGLQPNAAVERVLLDSEQLRQNVINDFLQDYSPEKASEDVRVLSIFGLIEPGFDLYHFYIELFSEQVAGYYDDETKQMFVVQAAGFQGPERMTYAHEYVHVLQDQVYDLENGLQYSSAACETDTERCAALQALIEGDASLLELKWFSSYATRQDIKEIMAFYQNFQSPVYDRAPQYLQQDFLFPYQAGQAFVQYLYDRGGWPAVDAAYQTPPLSTEQILHPERYPADQPWTVTLPDLSRVAAGNWQELDRGVMGEWYTYLVLAHGNHAKFRLPEAQATQAAAGWGGDAYAVYTEPQSGGTLMVLTTQWETPNDADEFAQAFQTYANARWTVRTLNDAGLQTWQVEDGYHQFVRRGKQTWWLFAPDLATMRAAWELLLASD